MPVKDMPLPDVPAEELPAEPESSRSECIGQRVAVFNELSISYEKRDYKSCVVKRKEVKQECRNDLYLMFYFQSLKGTAPSLAMSGRG